MKSAWLLVFLLLSVACDRNKAAGAAPNTGEATSAEVPRGDQPINTDVKDIARSSAGRLATSTTSTCVIRKTGELLCWGGNVNGEVGIGTHAWNGRTDDWLWDHETVAKPSSPQGLSRAKMIACGDYCCALDESNHAWCWGFLEETKASLAAVDAPRRVSHEVEFSKIAVSGHACGLTLDGRLYCWEGSSIASDTQEAGAVPLKGTLTGAIVPDEFTKKVKDVAVAHGATCALDQGGEVYCWGTNESGQLGQPSEVNESQQPLKVAIPPSLAVFASSAHFCAISISHEVWCWGANSRNQAGSGATRTVSPTRIPLEGASDQMALTRHASFVLDDQGIVWFWGSDINRPATTKNVQPLPKRVDSLRRIVRLAGGSTHACALDEDDNIWCWGWGQKMQLGNGKTDNYPGMVKVGFD